MSYKEYLGIFSIAALGVGDVLASSGYRPGRLLSILQGTGNPRMSQAKISATPRLKTLQIECSNILATRQKKLKHTFP